jgi:hypothetical protein
MSEESTAASAKVRSSSADDPEQSKEGHFSEGEREE